MSKKQNTKQVCIAVDSKGNEAPVEPTVQDQLKEHARQITELREALEQLLDDLWAQSAQEDSQEWSDEE